MQNEFPTPAGNCQNGSPYELGLGVAHGFKSLRALVNVVLRSGVAWKTCNHNISFENM